MSKGINKVIIIGNLGHSPELRTFPDGGTVANLSVATTERWKDQQGQQQERTEWHKVVLRNRLAEIAEQYLQSGSKVYIEGSLRTRKYQARDGSDRYVTEIMGRELQMLDGRQNSSAPQPSPHPEPSARPAPMPQQQIADDDIPF